MKNSPVKPLDVVQDNYTQIKIYAQKLQVYDESLSFDMQLEKIKIKDEKIYKYVLDQLESHKEYYNKYYKTIEDYCVRKQFFYEFSDEEKKILKALFDKLENCSTTVLADLFFRYPQNKYLGRN